MSRKIISIYCVLVHLVGLIYIVGNASDVSAQIEPPDRRFLFQEDKIRKETVKKKKKESQTKKDQAATSKILNGQQLPFDISAKTIDFDTDGSVLTATGNVIVSYATLVAEASQAKIDTTTNQAELTKDVRISDINASMTAEKASVNLESQEGSLEDVFLNFDEGDYRVSAKEVKKEKGEVYSLKDAVMTTCGCPEGEDCRPWSIYAGESRIEKDGYGQAWNSSLRVYDVPVFYMPYMIFPAKSQRQSGLLPMTFGPSRRTGFMAMVPFFWAINNSTDATITGVLESKVRTGADVEFRKLFERNHTLEAGIVYLNESQRIDPLTGKPRLLGTRVDGLADSSIDKNRIAGYWNEQWSGKIASQPLQLVIDGKYVSDDLLPREYERSAIAQQSDRFVTSSAVLRTAVGEDFSLDLSSEYNQSMVQSDDFVFQRLPQLSLSGMSFFRPFGESPYGLRLSVAHAANSTSFWRKEDYTGFRHEIQEQVKLPFYLGNYFDGAFSAGIRGTKYQLDAGDKMIVADTAVTTDETSADVATVVEPITTLLPDSSDRILPQFGTNVGTVFEKVFPVEEGNIFKYIGELGTKGRSQQITRMKHTFEPGVKYLYIPDVDQQDNPQFDSQDRISQRNVVTYSLTQRLFSRFESRNKYLFGVEEVTPRPENLGGLTGSGPLDQSVQFGVDPAVSGDYAPLRRGEIQELITFKLSQSYNLLDPLDVGAPAGTSQLSDANADLALYPNEYVRLRTRTDFDIEESSFNSYLIEGQLSNSRGDLMRSRLRFVDGSPETRQLESGVEVGLTDRVRLGYYTRYDDAIKEFIEQRAGVRLSSSCNCWNFDVLVTDQTNPNNTRLTFNITLMGLGELGNTLFQSVNQQNNSGLTQ